MKGFYLFLVSGFCMASVAGTIQVQGSGSASRAPEYVKISLNVVSQCYDKAIDAKNANAELANALFKTMQTYATADEDKVIATGGITQRQTEYDYTDQGRKIICQNKWHASNSLTLHLQDISRIAELQDQLLMSIDEQEELPGNAKTYAQLHAPNFALYPATQRELTDEAQRQAISDAARQFRIFEKSCGLQKGRLAKVELINAQTVPYRQAKAMAADIEQTPIQPDELRYEASWNFTFEYKGSQGCANR